MKVFRHFRQALATALLLVLLGQSALAADEGFNAGLDIQRTEDKILVIVENSNVLAIEQPTLTIPCDFTYAQVTFNNEALDFTLVDDTISFCVTAGGTYTIDELDSPPEDPDDPQPEDPDDPQPEDPDDPQPEDPDDPRPDRPVSPPSEEDNENESQDPETPSENPDTWNSPFTDVTADQWYYEEVGYVVNAGLMNGVSSTTFAPNDVTSRAMVWTVLARMNGVDTTVVDGPWYQSAMTWAMDSGISDGADPNEPITREQLVTMLYRMAGNPKMGDPSLAAVEQYPDGSKVSPWAYEAMAWALQTGLLEGANGLLVPGETATRAQLATILMRFYMIQD